MAATPTQASAEGETATIAGAVTDSVTSAPLAGTEVRASTFYLESGEPISITRTATTDAAGRYSMPDLAVYDSETERAYVYTVTATPSGSDHFAKTISPVLLTPDTTTTVDVALDAPSSITGTVRSGDAGTAPLAGVQVSTSQGSTTTDAAGTWTLTGLRAGDLKVTANLAGYLSKTQTFTLSPGQQSTSGNLTLTSIASTYGVVAGKVTTDDPTPLPLAGASVSVPGVGGTTTAADGSYSLPNVPAGKYTVSFSAAGYLSAESTVTVTARTTSSLSKALAKDNTPPPVPAVSLKGHATGDGGKILPGFKVTLTSAGATFPGTVTYVDFAGDFSIASVGPGTYTLAIYPNSSSSSGDKEYLRFTTTVKSAGVPIVIDAHLVKPGKVTGYIATSDKAAAAVDVRLYTAAGEATYYRTTASGGSYQFGNVTPGVYKIGFSAEHYLPLWWKSATDIQSAPTITVASSGKVTDKNVTLQRLSVFTGTGSVTLSGTPSVGSTLTARVSGLKPAADSYTYRWTVDGYADEDSTEATYPLTVADLGKRISVQVTAKKFGYETRYLGGSAQTPLINYPLSTSGVTISGASSPTVGSTLTAVTDAWQPSPVALAYQWRRDGAPIAGATSRTYVIASADAGKALDVAVTGSKAGYQPSTVVSARTPAVTFALTLQSSPKITGNAIVGSTLTASTGSWSPSATSYTYQWYRGDLLIVGARGATRTLTVNDAGAQMSVVVTASKSGYASGQKRSALTAPVISRLASPPTPSVAGAAKVGATVLVSTPAWAPAPVGLTFQWSRSGTPIPGATGTAYTITSADVGKTLTVTVTGSKVGYLTDSRTSPATRPVVK